MCYLHNFKSKYNVLLVSIYI